MTLLRKKYPDYAYKEAALNPTNPRNRAVEWETDIVNAFRNDPARGEISGTRETPTGRSLYLARPFQIKDPACLACHTTPEMAPAAMVKIYGPNNGFGWKLNEVIGAQIVSVPMSLPIRNANRAFYTFMGSLAVVFVVLFVILNVMLTLLIVRADHRSCRRRPTRSPPATWTSPSSPTQGSDEVSLLGQVVQPHAPQPGEGDQPDRQEVDAMASRCPTPCPAATRCTNTASRRCSASAASG